MARRRRGKNRKRHPKNAKRASEQSSTTEVVHAAGAIASANAIPGGWNGQKFPGGWGSDDFFFSMDYWTLRQRSVELFEKNIYARGLIRRLITNEIHTGLHLEATPEEAILGLEEYELADWAENVENRFALWGRDPKLCDFAEEKTFGHLQQVARMEALLEGDMLVVVHQSRRTGLPLVQLIRGSAVRSPSLTHGPRKGNRIEHGVELDGRGRQVAYWVRNEKGAPRRLPARGEKSGRRIAWLVYGTERRHGSVRGVPLLSIVLQALRELDRYRDSALRKAVLNSMLAMFIEKSNDKPGSRPITGGAVRRGTLQAEPTDGSPRQFSSADLIPGLVIEELQAGETPKPMPSTGTDEKLGPFEQAIIAAVAWANEIPPEILTLSFGSNYSASQAAINEFKTYLNRVRTTWGATFCQPIYMEWLISEAINGAIRAPDLLRAWREPSLYDVFGAWTSAGWAGNIKPAVDLSKLVKGYVAMVDEGFMTRDRASRELNGSKYSKNVAKLKLENEQLKSARAALGAPAGAAPPAGDAEDTADESTDDGNEQPDGFGEEKAA